MHEDPHRTELLTAALSATLVFTFIAALVFAPTADAAPKKWDDNKGCMSCHEGIERISDIKKMANSPVSTVIRATGMRPKSRPRTRGCMPTPSDLRVADEVCGECHEDEIAAVKTSLHATRPG